jgi:ribosomal-protein-alanine N-acetyltransferase
MGAGDEPAAPESFSMSTVAGPVIVAADERHLDALMDVMRASFDPSYGEAWSSLQLAGTLGLDASFARRALDNEGVTIGFALCRVAGPEVELLLVAVAPEERGRGLGRLLVETVTRDAARKGAKDLFLEVRENNTAARRLYLSLGFREVGHRPDYYAGHSGTRFAAVTMKRSIDDLAM